MDPQSLLSPAQRAAWEAAGGGYLNPLHNRGLWVEMGGECWLNTGDLGRQDSDGYFWLTGRKKELIIRGGHNIDPKMIEEPLHAHPAVAIPVTAVGKIFKPTLQMREIEGVIRRECEALGVEPAGLEVFQDSRRGLAARVEVRGDAALALREVLGGYAFAVEWGEG